MLRLVSYLALALVFLTPVSTSAAPPTQEVNALLTKLGDAFNRGDAKAGAALFATDGDLINPTGKQGQGRAAVEKIMATDMQTILKGARSTFTADTVRELAPNVWLVDATHMGQGMKGPDGKAMTSKIHLVAIVTRAKDNTLQISAARPYMFMQPKETVARAPSGEAAPPPPQP
jgi:uncharacterized protein (TIGR02246 family)